MIIVTIGVLILTIREFLILIGLYKDPLLRQFERYGEPPAYSPLLNFGMTLLLFLAVLMVLITNSALLGLWIILLTLPGMHLYRYLKRFIWQYPEVMLAYPLWCNQLVDRASREERRRLAYMWLRLPYRTRLTFNASDRQFDQWVDLVLITII